jgi:hypothetical protein
MQSRAMVEVRHRRPRLSKESGALLILHTLVFSFGDRRTPEERDEFLAQIKEICLGSGLTQHVATGVHKPATEDQYAPVFVSSAIAQLLCENMETLGQLSAYEPLVTFEQGQQKLKPYGVVWVNSDPLDLLGS